MQNTVHVNSSTMNVLYIYATLCAAATSVYGRFSFLDLVYERELATTSSVSFKELSQRISTEIERELYSFTLPGRFEVSIQNFFNRSCTIESSYIIARNTD